MKARRVLCTYGLILLVSFFGSQTVRAQSGINDTILTQAVIYNGDTIEAKTLDNIAFFSRFDESKMSDKAKYNRLRNAVYVTYPYARRAGAVMNDINHYLAGISKKSGRKDYIRTREKELKKEFTDPLTNLSVYQGKVLMKLINRETGNDCYEIIREYKGNVTARLYQTVAFFFNSNLKQPYDPVKDDKTIESLVREVQRMYGFVEVRKAPIM